MKRVYIASPFFTREQKKVVEHIEAKLLRLGMPYFSPRSFGILQDMSQAEKELRSTEIYHKNIAEIDRADLIIAYIDGWDCGTTFEIGYAACANKDIITLSVCNYGLNVMIQKAVIAHIHDVENIGDAINEPHKFRKFNPNVI